MNILILEDNLDRISEFRRTLSGEDLCFIDNASGCIELLKEYKYDLIFLDHDLGGKVFVSVDEENTGSTVSKWMRDNDFESKGAPVIIHSMNFPAVEHMRSHLPESKHIPLVWKRSVFNSNIRFNK